MKKDKRKKQLRRQRAGKVNRQVKDVLFRFLFEKDREALLQLYNALNGTDYQDASKLEVVTIESAVYIVMKNDLAFVITGTINLYEHQSTWNPNMPVRFFIYLAKEYQKLLEEAEQSIYGTSQIALPAPQCVVFYNGTRDVPEEQVLRLSDAFENKQVEADVELKVRVLNINYGYNRELLSKCRALREYAEFVEISRQYSAKEMDMKEAMGEAVQYCIEHDILADFLRKYRAEVLGMLLEKFDKKKYVRTLKREASEQERARLNRLTQILIEQNRVDDLKRAAEDIGFQEQLLQELHLGLSPEDDKEWLDFIG